MPPPTSVFMPVDTALGLFIASLQANGSKITDFSTGSGTRSLAEAFATVVSLNSQTADQLQLDSYLDTATGDALDALGSNWQVPRNPAVQAAGTVSITRQSTSGTLVIPAGWGQLSTSPSVPGQLGVAVVTTEDANFADTVATVTVNAQAVIGGIAGNLTAGILLTPLSPITGISSQTGYEIAANFTNGVDQETDGAYRARIPIAVQGRALGKEVSFLAAALSVPGVLSANVLLPGDTRGDSTTVPVNTVEVYYQGSAGLLSGVRSAVDNAATATQDPSTFASVSLGAPRGQKRVIASFTVFCLAGTDTTALGIAVAAALQAYVDGVGVGNTAYLSEAIEAVHGVPAVVSVAVPPTTFCLSGGSGAADIAIAGDSYPNLASGDTTIAVTVL